MIYRSLFRVYSLCCRNNMDFFFFSSRRRHTRCALVTGVQTCALPISLAAEAGSAMVIVNTVVLVKEMGRTQGEVALALAAYGGGSMLADRKSTRLNSSH